MAQAVLLYIATSTVREIRKGASVTFTWGKYGSWTKFKNPTPKTKKKVAYNAKTKNKVNTKNGKLGGAGGVTVYGTTIPATATRTISGVSRTCAVRYRQRGYVIYDRPKSLKTNNKMYKSTFTNSYPYQYRLQYEDKAVLNEEYTDYINGMEFVFFADHYYDDGGEAIPTDAHIPHPQKCDLTYSDCRRNFTTSANNTDGRDNSGSYVLDNVRANIVTLDLEWEGLGENEGIDLLNALNPEKDKTGNYPYIQAQFIDPQTGAHKNGVFYAGERKVEKLSDGTFRKIAVTLTEV